MESNAAKPRRGMTEVASHFNGWERNGQGKACRRYATSPYYGRVPKGTPVTIANIPAVKNGWLPLSDAYGIGFAEFAELELSNN